MGRAPEFSDDLGGVVVCPSCGCDYLHHETVEVFDRQEDAPDGLHVVVDSRSYSVRTDANLDGNPSSRRHGLRIELWCEGCHEVCWLVLEQHKGNTHLRIEPTGRTAPVSGRPRQESWRQMVKRMNAEAEARTLRAAARWLAENEPGTPMPDWVDRAVNGRSSIHGS